MIFKQKRTFASLITWGSQQGSLGYQAGNLGTTYPQPIPDFDHEIRKVVMGNNHSAIVTEDGELYLFGLGREGQLGQDNQKSQITPTLVSGFKEIDKKVEDVALGDYHTVILTTDGEVWTTGYGGQLTGGWIRALLSQPGGALGHGDMLNKFVPTPVLTLRESEDITQIAAGSYHTLALGQSGQLYIWGRGQYGVMGNGSSSNAQMPIENEFFETLTSEGTSIKSIHAAAHFSAVLTEDGRVFTWGLNGEGQLGTGTSLGLDMYECQRYPVQVLEDKPIQQIEVGEYSIMFRSTDQEFYIAGLKTWWDPYLKQVPSDERITSMFTGAKFTGVVTDKNNLYVVRHGFSKKDVEESIELGMWKVNQTLFKDFLIKEIGGRYKNHYALIV